ncbi:CubicO group peptidase (beta-lactamase class C family) [Motilibacter rhizosphaerae]|uniref:CubicO group peptidase (Beta-lactamase class C family) n=1 Tax=Motilibacter rhizosphaerae TaxID=598652 RepID=A0A4Q7N765_9ACTN|nr:serine hydrolase domain-containing protein [Motilibacter rhizosphaerae]RZS77553.1 CubicO group peptidase (beta-lactamase class C family) [Motilibacter rhizosphaerae]
MSEPRGTCDPRFDHVRSTFEELLQHDEGGASVAVVLDGELVVDLWGGYVDAARSAPWERDTIACLNSTTKNLVSLCALLLSDRGALDLDAPLAAYWHEFAAAGKEGVLVRHVLSHTAGLPHLPGATEVAHLYDWPRITAGLAAAAPAWPPGTAGGYHALSYGYLVGELVRRTSGYGIARFFDEQVAGPLGADVHIGLAPEHDSRVAPLIPPPSLQDDYTATAPAAAAPDLQGGVRIRVRDVNSLAWRRADVPAVNGFGNARSVALAHSVLAGRGVAAGVRLLSAAGCAPAWQPVCTGVDRVLGAPVTWTTGFAAFGTAVGWGGWGGSLVVSDPTAGMTVAYVMNQMRDRDRHGDDRGLSLVLAAYGALR